MATSCDSGTVLRSVRAFQGSGLKYIRLAQTGLLCNIAFPPTPPPTAPSSLVATGNLGTPSVGLTWVQGTGVITSVLLFRQVNGGGFSLYQTLGVVTSYTDTGVSIGNTYGYQVFDHNAGGNSPASNIATATLAFDPEVDDWADVRVPGNSGTVSAATNLAAQNFMTAIKAVAGLRAKILRLNLFAGQALSAIPGTTTGGMFVPLIKDAGPALDVPVSTSNWFNYNETGVGGGLQDAGTGSGVYVNTGFIPSVQWSDLNDQHFGIYVVTGATQASFQLGAQSGGLNETGLVGPDYPAVGTRADINTAGGAVADPLGKGFYLAQKESTGIITLFKNGVSISSTADPGGGFPTVPIWIFCLNASNIHVAGSTKVLALYCLGLRLTVPQQLGFYNAVQAFQTALGRQV